MGPERHPSALGARGRDCWDEIWDIIGPQIEYVMAGNGATWHEDQLVPVTRHGRREDVWWTYSFGPIDVDGKVGGVLVVCKDVTSEHMAREALNLINEELKHRVKNTLTVLGAVATQTFRDEASKADLEKYQGRLAAFGRAHDLLTAANWAAAPLQDVISTALVPYRTGDSRFAVSGPPLIVKSQTGARSVSGHPRACDQRFEVWRADGGERPRVGYMDDPKIRRVSQNSFSSGASSVAHLRRSPPLWALVRASFPGCYRTISGAPWKCRINQADSFAA